MQNVIANSLTRVRRKLGRITARACERNEGLFQLLYHRIAARPAAISRRLQKFEPAIESELDRVVRKVRENGVAVWPGLFDDAEFLEEANDMVAALEVAAREAIERSGQDSGVYDEDRDCHYWPNTPHRVRSFFAAAGKTTRQPPLIKQLMQEPVLREVDYRLRSTHNIFGILAESLHPGEEHQEWHLDVLGDQLKAMVLLTDVERQHGPMEYKVGSHLLPIPQRWDPDQQRGVSFSPAQVAELPGELIYATGKAGDCIFFDSHGVHRGTDCTEDRRQNLVVYFQGGDTRRNSMVRFLAGA